MEKNGRLGCLRLLHQTAPLNPFRLCPIAIYLISWSLSNRILVDFTAFLVLFRCSSISEKFDLMDSLRFFGILWDFWCFWEYSASLKGLIWWILWDSLGFLWIFETFCGSVSVSVSLMDLFDGILWDSLGFLRCFVVLCQFQHLWWIYLMDFFWGFFGIFGVFPDFPSSVVFMDGIPLRFYGKFGVFETVLWFCVSFSVLFVISEGLHLMDSLGFFGICDRLVEHCRRHWLKRNLINVS